MGCSTLWAEGERVGLPDIDRVGGSVMDREYSDRQRRRQRLQRESMELAESHFGNTPPVDYCHSRNLTGIPSPGNATHRAAESSWDMHHAPTVDSEGVTHHRAVGKVRCVGGDIRVTRPDGTIEIRPVSSFRAPRNVKTTKRDSVENANRVQDELAAQSHRLELLAKAGNASDYNN